MGCHRRLGYARLLNRSGFGFVTVLVSTYVSRFPHYSARSLKKAFSVCFHSVQPLPNSHNKSSFFLHTNPSRSTCFPIASRRFSHSTTLHFLNRISNPHLPLVSLHTTFTQAPFNQPQVFPPNPTPTKTCAKPLCILQRSQVVQSLSISCFPPHSNSQSARDVPVVTSLHLLPTTSVSRLS